MAVTIFGTERDKQGHAPQRLDSFKKFKNVKDPLALFQELYTYNAMKQVNFRLYCSEEGKVDPRFDEIAKRTDIGNDIQMIAEFMRVFGRGQDPMFGKGQYLLVRVLAIEPKEGSGVAYDVQFDAIPANGKTGTARCIIATTDGNGPLASDAAELIAKMKPVILPASGSSDASQP